MRGFAMGRGVSSRALMTAALCSFLLFSFCPVNAFAGADAGESPAMTVLYINGPNWPGTDVKIEALAAAATVRSSDCSGGSLDTRTVAAHGFELLEHFGEAGLCSDPVTLADGTRIGVVQLPIFGGQASATSEAIYLDAAGVLNVVNIPSLPRPIDEGERYVFPGVETDPDVSVDKRRKRTSIALVTADGGSAEVEITMRDARGELVTSASGSPIAQSETVNGFAMIELTIPVRIGTATVTVVPSRVSPPIPSSRVYAVAFKAFDGGAPIAIVPRFETGV